MSYQSSLIHILDVKFQQHVNETEFQTWLNQVTDLLERQQRFVLVIQSAPETHFYDNYRLLQASWYKRYKDQFFQYCIGLARIALDDTDQVRLNSPALHAAWRVPYFVSLDHQQAMQWALQRWTQP